MLVTEFSIWYSSHGGSCCLNSRAFVRSLYRHVFLSTLFLYIVLWCDSFCMLFYVSCYIFLLDYLYFLLYVENSVTIGFLSDSEFSALPLFVFLNVFSLIMPSHIVRISKSKINLLYIQCLFQISWDSWSITLVLSPIILIFQTMVYSL